MDGNTHTHSSHRCFVLGNELNNPWIHSNKEEMFCYFWRRLRADWQICQLIQRGGGSRCALRPRQMVRLRHIFCSELGGHSKVCSTYCLLRPFTSDLITATVGDVYLPGSQSPCHWPEKEQRRWNSSSFTTDPHRHTHIGRSLGESCSV